MYVDEPAKISSKADNSEWMLRHSLFVVDRHTHGGGNGWNTRRRYKKP